MDSVLHAAANTAEDFPGGTTGMAGALGKNKFSLMHELAGTGAAKLGLLDAVKMVKRSRDQRILNAFAVECGCLVIPLPEALMVEGDNTMLNLGHLAKEFADVVQEVTASVSDDTISQNEMARLERQWAELVAAGQQMMVQLRARHEASEQARPGLKVA